MLELGNSKLIGLYLGSTEIKKAYLGTELVFNPSTSKLPAGYTELEYIESSGTQYVDTGYKPTTFTEVVIDVLMSPFVSNTALFGARQTNSATSPLQYVVMNPQINRLRYDYFGENKLFGANLLDLSDRTLITASENVLIADGHSISLTEPSNNEKTVPYFMYLFSFNNLGNASSKSSMKMYSCKIYNVGMLVRDYVPCTNSIGNVGLYDIVNGQFYENAGSGSFIAGPVIEG